MCIGPEMWSLVNLQIIILTKTPMTIYMNLILQNVNALELPTFKYKTNNFEVILREIAT